MRLILISLYFVLVLSFFMCPSCSLLKQTDCELAASITSQAVRLLCASQSIATQSSKQSNSENFFILDSDTCRYVISYCNKKVQITWYTTKGFSGTLTKNF